MVIEPTKSKMYMSFRNARKRILMKEFGIGKGVSSDALTKHMVTGRRELDREHLGRRVM